MSAQGTSAHPALRRNVIAVYASQAFVTIAGVIVVPLYLQYLGAEAFGLIGFFTLLQSAFGLLDLGLTRTIGRETARFHANPADAEKYRRLFHALQLIFLGIAATGAIILVLLAGKISTHWLRSSLPTSEVHFALQMMALTVPLRWMSGLYSGVIVGSERIVWISAFNVIVAATRYGGALTAMTLFGATPAVFFSYQLVVAVLALAAIVMMAYLQLPRLAKRVHMGWSMAPIVPLVRFSMTVAGTAGIWVLVTQTDKLLLSKLLHLEEYGTFSLGVLVAGTVLVATGPIATPLMPRFTHMEARAETERMVALYRGATQLVAVLGFAISMTLAAFAEPVLWAWTGHADAAARAAPVLAFYALGNTLLTLSRMPFYLQYAKGDLRQNLIGSLLFLLVMAPSITLATLTFGMVGAGWVWLGTNLAFFAFWVPIMHHRLYPGLHAPWLMRDVLPILASAGVAAFLAWTLAPATDSRVMALAVAGASGLVTLAAAMAASNAARAQLGRLLGWRPSKAPPDPQQAVDAATLSSAHQTQEFDVAGPSPAILAAPKPGSAAGSVAAPATPAGMPKVSVCVVAYNQARYIRECLDSLLAQRAAFPYEVIVGDDASTDGTTDIIRDYARRFPEKVVAVLHETNIGPTKNYHSVHNRARAPYVAHMDGDDVAYPDKLQRLADALDANPDCTVAVHDMDLITVDGRPLGRTYSPILPQKATIDYLVQHGAYFAHSSKMYRASANLTRDAGGRSLLDLHVHIEHAASGAIVGLPEPLGAYRVASGITAMRNWDEAVLAAHRIAIDRAAELGCSPAVVKRGRLRVEYRTAMKHLNHGNEEAFRGLIRLRGRQYLHAPWRHVLFSLLRNNRLALQGYLRLVQWRHVRAARRTVEGPGKGL